MKYNLFELFVNIGGEQLNFELGDRPLLVGSDKSCDICLDESFKKISAMIKKKDSVIFVKIYDEKLPILINGKKYKSAKFDKSIFIKLGPYDLIFNIEEHKLMSTFEEDFTSGFQLEDYIDGNVESAQVLLQEINNQPTLPKSLSADNMGVLSEELVPSETGRDESNSFKPQFIDPASTELEDLFKFDIHFDETNSNVLVENPYQDKDLDFSSYVDVRDETVKEIPVPDIHKPKITKSIHVTYLNNGVVLNDRYFEETKIKRIFLSKSYNQKNYMQAFDIGSEKQEFIFYRNNKITILKPKNYIAQKVFGEDVVEIDLKTLDLNVGEKVVLTNGTSQIIIHHTETPPSLKTSRYFDIEEKLLKAVASSWAFALLLLGIVVAFPPINEQVEEDKVVVIYKRKEVDKSIEKPLPTTVENTQSELEVAPIEEISLESAPAESELVKEKTDQVQQVVKQKKIPKVEAPRLHKNKNEIANKSFQKRRKSKVALKSAPKKTPKKKFKFNFGSKMKTILSDTSNTKLKKVRNKKSLNLAKSMKSSSKITSKFNKKNLGVTNSKVSRFTAGNPSAKKAVMGTKGLSGKTKTTTAYIEDTTKILGAIDPELIRVVMREYIPQFRHCYQRELITNPSVAGIFDIKFQINKKGTGVNIGVKSKGKAFSRTGKSCLKRVVSLIKFPKPKGGGLVDVRQPMNFYKQ